MSAETTHPDAPTSLDDWILCVHWLQHGPVSADTEAALPQVLATIRAHYAERGRAAPSRMEVRGPDHGLLLTVE
ncbi:hypothetical protein [Streptacidiphilus cavernicola]|uniref:Uncharacterized protein n=1 Tax=Streptacidiphilus cavernicola TaxID=3342716 RepID=A0ABV6VSL2_9ACTN